MNGYFIIVTGDPIEGFTFVGPFDSEKDAAKHGNTDGNLKAGDWWIAPLEEP